MYVRATAELKRVDLSSLSRQDKIALFINIYNALVIHAFVVQGPPNTLWKRYKVINKYSPLYSSAHAYVISKLGLSLVYVHRCDAQLTPTQ